MILNSYAAAVIGMALLAPRLTSPAVIQRAVEPAECVQDTMWQSLLVRTVRDGFLLDEGWRATRERWGWKAEANEIRPSTDERSCARARHAIEAYGYRGRHLRPLLLVRAGNLYVAQPAETGDTWFFLGPDWRVLDMVIVPS